MTNYGIVRHRKNNDVIEKFQENSTVRAPEKGVGFKSRLHRTLEGPAGDQAHGERTYKELVLFKA
jgi:hypothetical protein